MAETLPTRTLAWRLVVTVLAAIGVQAIFFGVVYGAKSLQGPVVWDDTCFGGLGIAYFLFLVVGGTYPIETGPAKSLRWQWAGNILAIVPFVASAFIVGQIVTGETWYNQLVPYFWCWPYPPVITWAWLLVGTTVIARKLWHVQGYIRETPDPQNQKDPTDLW